MKKDFEPNEAFWRARTDLGLSRPEVADAANQEPVMRTCEHAPMDENYIGRIEQGRIGGGMCPQRRSALCAVLNVTDPAKIGLVAERRLPTRSAPAHPRKSLRHVTKRATSDDVPDTNLPLADYTGVTDVAEPNADMDRRRVIASLASPAIAAVVGAILKPIDWDEPHVPQEPLVPEALAAELSTVRAAYQHSRYRTATKALPSLLAGVRGARTTMEGRQAAALEVETYQVASGLLLKSGEPILATIAAERCAAAAERSEDELSIGCAARAYAHCLMAVGHAREGIGLAVNAADRLSAYVDMSRPAALSVYGALLLRAGIAAARCEDRDQAYDLLDAAAQAAACLGADRNLRWTAFGPANVTAHRVAIAVELGDAGSAVAYADKIEMAALTLPERRAMVFLDTARALIQWGKWDRAFDAIRQAEQHAPEEIRQRPAVHQLIDELAQRSPAPLQRQVLTFADAVRADV